MLSSTRPVAGNGNGGASGVAVETAGSVRQAAEVASETYAPTEVSKHAEVLIDAWRIRLREQSKSYVQRASQLHRERLQIAGPINPTYPLYPYWGLFIAGPFQPINNGPYGPFLPHKIIRAGEPAFMLYALWRNPACMNWTCPAPSACEVMSQWDARLWMRTGNLTKWEKGPSFGPIDIKLANHPICSDFGFVELTAPEPPDGEPDLYELSATVDIVGPGAVSFAGFSTWAFDPDNDPFEPLLGTTPHWQFEIPVRYMVYTR